MEQPLFAERASADAGEQVRWRDSFAAVPALALEDLADLAVVVSSITAGQSQKAERGGPFETLATLGVLERLAAHQPHRRAARRG
jgi:hypothetical protein